jgi:hypothetical protein
LVSEMTIRIPHAARLSTALIAILATLLQAGCSSNDTPPYYTALVTNVYKEQTTVEHFSLLYSWEERGETPFLKPYSLVSKELIVEVMTPSKEDISRVTLVTQRYPFDALEGIDIELTDVGKQIIISTKDKRRITASINFPSILKKDKASGFAEMKMYVQGKKNENGKQVDYKLDSTFIKKIAFIKRIDS